MTASGAWIADLPSTDREPGPHEHDPVRIRARVPLKRAVLGHGHFGHGRAQHHYIAVWRKNSGTNTSTFRRIHTAAAALGLSRTLRMILRSVKQYRGKAGVMYAVLCIRHANL